MGRKELLKRTWRANQGIEYTHPRLGNTKTMLLVSIDFDKEILGLAPMSGEYKNEVFHVNARHCKVLKRPR